jgi:glutathione synthase/RimK-type ligase-like ATP-grasp enzyme
MAVQALGLDFGAADVGFNNNKASVYEVNTACGLMGKTLEAYAEAIRHVQMD